MSEETKTLEIVESVKKQREYYLEGNTLNIDNRLSLLKEIRKELIINEKEIFEAFLNDFNKGDFDVVSTELSMVIMEIDFFLKNLKKLSKRKRVRTSIINFPSKGYIYHEPLGVTLIMSPWNYPLQLALEPLVGSIAAGNTVILKPSSYSENVSHIIKKIFDKFDSRIIKVIEGGRKENAALLDEKFDFIFFTGGTSVAKVVLEKASKNLTPVALELGGKSPCIVDKDCNIEFAAKRITWGKFLNAGQTCVAPDYILVHEDIKKEFIENVKKYIKHFYYLNDSILSKDFPHIINDKHTERLKSLIDENKLVCGGYLNDRIIAPTVLDNVSFDDLVMQEEIFGPIMPIITFKDLEEDVIKKLRTLEKPLALYYFTNDLKKADYLLKHTTSGGSCINDTIMHLTNENLPFGGVGNSGMGSYHGEKSFETFSHYRSVLIKSKNEINLKYPPYNEKKKAMVKKFTKLK